MRAVTRSRRTNSSWSASGSTTPRLFSSTCGASTSGIQSDERWGTSRRVRRLRLSNRPLSFWAPAVCTARHGVCSHPVRLRPSHRAKADGLGKGRPCAAGFGEALHDLLPLPRGGVPEHDPAVEIDPLERRRCRIALCPARIRKVLLRRVRDRACAEEERDSARADDDRVQRRRSRPRWSSARTRQISRMGTSVEDGWRGVYQRRTT